MDIDVTRLLGAATRQVVDGVRGGVAVHIVRVFRTYDTTVEDLWDALTTVERIPRWFLPVSGGARPGAGTSWLGNAGGEVTACKAPTAFTLTWEFGEQTSWVEVELSSDPDGGARLELSHAVPVDAHWDEFGPGAVGIGWDLTLMGLELHLRSGKAVDPTEVQAWQLTDDARTFVTLASEAWFQAALAGRVPPATARAMADRTTAAYTGTA